MAQELRRILIVDDDNGVRDSMQKWLEMDGYEVVGAQDAATALGLLEREAFDLALVDIRMPGMDGVELQRRIRQVDHDLPVVIVTAYASIETAVEVLKRGAMDYLTKPVDPDDLSRLVRRALQRDAGAESAASGRPGEVARAAGELLAGQTREIARARDLIAEAARTDQPVLITGERGTGRHLAAAAIHGASRRRFFDLVPFDCRGLDEASFERLLLAPACSGPGKSRFQLADGGTLLLEAVDALPPGLQGTLLQLLESKTAHPPGARQPLVSDFRAIAISEIPLRALVETGGLSEALYYRLAVLVIELPPLRAIASDVPLIAQALLERIRAEDTTLPALEGFAAGALERLASHDWPGNVAELANVVRRAAAAAAPPLITDVAIEVRPGGE